MTTVTIEHWRVDRPAGAGPGLRDEGYTLIYTEKGQEYRLRTADTESGVRAFAEMNGWTVGEVNDDMTVSTAERVLVYGSRTWRDPEPIRAFIYSLPADATVVHGAQRSYDKATGELYGADYYADLFAKERGLAVESHPAQWTVHETCRCRSHRGRCLGAGPRRNAVMAKANLTRAQGFRSDGDSRGTDDMTRRLVQAGIPHALTTPTTPSPATRGGEGDAG